MMVIIMKCIIKVFNHSLFLQNLQLAIPDRHMVYSSQLLMQEGTTSQTVTGWLLSDMLLFTRSEVKDMLTLVEEPIMLQDIVSCELGCDHCKFAKANLFFKKSLHMD